MKEQVENERKFLLRRQPQVDPMVWDKVFVLSQYYLEDNTRYRELQNRLDPSDVKYEKVKKEDTDSSASRIEQLEIIDKPEFEEGRKKAIKGITKYRLVLEEDDYKIEVDHFIDIDLNVAEIEITSDGISDDTTARLFDVELPDFIADEMIMEVTEYDGFKNTNLSLPINT